MVEQQIIVGQPKSTEEGVHRAPKEYSRLLRTGQSSEDRRLSPLKWEPVGSADRELRATDSTTGSAPTAEAGPFPRLSDAGRGGDNLYSPFQL